MNLNKILALTLMALLTACASTQEKEAQTAKEEQAQKALDELNRQVRSQSDMANSSAKQAAQSQKAIQSQSNAPVKGVDQYGELPYRPVPVSVQQVQAPQADNNAVAQITARKNSLMEDRKKLWARQRALDDDKQKLGQAAEQLKSQRLELVSAMKIAGVKQP